jgi:DDE superfamily endonuclease
MYNSVPSTSAIAPLVASAASSSDGFSSPVALSTNGVKHVMYRDSVDWAPPKMSAHWPCWSWDSESKLWSGKHKTTGHGFLIVTNLQGRIFFVSEPVTGSQHDMEKLKGSATEKILLERWRSVRRQGVPARITLLLQSANRNVAGFCNGNTNGTIG